MNRADKLRRVIPGAGDELIAVLAARPAADVDLVVAAVRQGIRDDRQHQAGKRRQAKADARRYRHHDESDLAGRDTRTMEARGRRAAQGDLDALAALAQFLRDGDRVLHLAVAGLRARGDVSDEVIGKYLGITRQSVGERFGRKGSLTNSGLA